MVGLGSNQTLCWVVVPEEGIFRFRYQLNCCTVSLHLEVL